MQSSLGTPTLSAILFFILIVILTLVVTYWAARRTRSTKEFYAAGRSVSPLLLRALFAFLCASAEVASEGLTWILRSTFR